MNIKRGTNPVARAFYGFRTYLRGIQWLWGHKRYLALSFIPTLIGLAMLGASWGYFFSHLDQMISLFIFDKPTEWYWLIGYGLLYAFTFLMILGISLLGSLLLINVVASPLYEIVSCAVEKDLLGRVESISFWHTLKLMGEELKKIGCILGLALISLLVTSWVPGLNILALLFTAFLVGWEFYDYPLARRGWRFRDRLSFVMKDVWSVTAFGLWMLIPFMQFFLVPLASAGATILALEGLMEHQKDERS